MAQQTPAEEAGTARPEVRVGVLAHRGWTAYESDWAPLERYLDGRLPGRDVRFLPVTLSSAAQLIEQGGLDFLVTNPGHYVTLAERYPVSVLATRARRMPEGRIATEFGSALVVRARSGRSELEDVAGARVAAVDPHAFGGFRVAWRELRDRGVNIYEAAEELRFLGFPQDRIVEAVLSGEADVGIVRSGLVERMAAEGRIDPARVAVLNANVTYTHPEAVSTRLYPEWPFLAMADTPRAVRDAVALALLTAGTGAAGLRDGWSAPVSYRAVRALEAEFAAAHGAEAAPARAPLARFWLPAAALALLFVIAAAVLRGRAPRRAAPSSGASPAPEPVPLTRRERQVLDQIAAGRSSKEIAAALGISPKTVEFHRSNLLRKFDAKSAVQLVSRARPPAT